MRNAFAAEITALAKEDSRVVLCSGDIGNRLFDAFKASSPDRFFNCGVAEANMMGVAAGMAFCGLRPFVYTITPFATTRCLEQIRVDVCYHNVPVVIAGVGSGLSYASLGATHHSCEDIAFLRALPNMSVVCPGDALEVRQIVRAALKHDGPLYIRLGKKAEPKVHKAPPNLQIGEAIVVSDGVDVCLLSTGNVLPIAVGAAEEMARNGIKPRVVSFHTVKPLDERMLHEVFSRFRVVVTLEEHSLIGGFGSAVAEWLADQQPCEARLCRIGTKDEFLHEAGEQDYARERLGLTPKHIFEQVVRALPTAPAR
jgi:transketolase